MKLSLVCLAASAIAAEKEARLLVSKKTEAKVLAQNQDLTFNYKIYNIGEDAATEVSCIFNSLNTL